MKHWHFSQHWIKHLYLIVNSCFILGLLILNKFIKNARYVYQFIVQLVPMIDRNTAFKGLNDMGLVKFCSS